MSKAKPHTLKTTATNFRKKKKHYANEAQEKHAIK